MITLGAFNQISGIRHAFFTRDGGVSEGIYASKNCGFGSGDARENVARNRERCMAALDVGNPALVTVHQTHSTVVVRAERPWEPDQAPQADALVTDRPGIALGILTADCAPVLFADRNSGVVGAAHAGWKGTLDGVLENTIAAMAGLGAKPPRIVVGIGPRIAQRSYEVGPELHDRFVAADAESGQFFAPGRREDRFMFDLARYIALRLGRLGLVNLNLAPNDTFHEERRFFSYRRACLRGEPDYGRCLSAIVIEQ